MAQYEITAKFEENHSVFSKRILIGWNWNRKPPKHRKNKKLKLFVDCRRAIDCLPRVAFFNYLKKYLTHYIEEYWEVSTHFILSDVVILFNEKMCMNLTRRLNYMLISFRVWWSTFKEVLQSDLLLSLKVYNYYIIVLYVIILYVMYFVCD